ncbi:hypothetical protein K493DRAFT_297212 [Basidiobolus meristosporus CBS 931.73]|uniref:Uncharacterized protein n=1 Tax=Basidiobolus meristosporus CBS 931.73 TaxID=1314790 RepID=A0A1Y1Z119_9FUNG|nr:hypothetical protein K493DRAFT_297212 [Basidiobolus meristosporus CBS 931.73]|eukprot:ORY03981.1 hypothetical protein K493DRAFT_297212 [Basidiobolus meristosporus CBS 931.73]
MSLYLSFVSTLRKGSLRSPVQLVCRMSSTTTQQKLHEAQEEYRKVASKLAKQIGASPNDELIERLEIDLAIARQKVKRFQLLADKASPKEETRGSLNAREFLVASLSGEISPEMVKNVQEKIPDVKITPTYTNLKDIAKGLSQEVK